MAAILTDADKALIENDPLLVYQRLVTLDWRPSIIDINERYVRFDDDSLNYVEISFPDDDTVQVAIDRTPEEWYLSIRLRVPFIGGGRSPCTRTAFMYAAWLAMTLRPGNKPVANALLPLSPFTPRRADQPKESDGYLLTLLAALFQRPVWPEGLETTRKYRFYESPEPERDWDNESSKCLDILHSHDSDTWLSMVPEIDTETRGVSSRRELCFRRSEQPYVHQTLVFAAAATAMDEVDYSIAFCVERRQRAEEEYAQAIRDDEERWRQLEAGQTNDESE